MFVCVGLVVCWLCVDVLCFVWQSGNNGCNSIYAIFERLRMLIQPSSLFGSRVGPIDVFSVDGWRNQKAEIL